MAGRLLITGLITESKLKNWPNTGSYPMACSGMRLVAIASAHTRVPAWYPPNKASTLVNPKPNKPYLLGLFDSELLVLFLSIELTLFANP